ncbi:hypothetical protein AVW11_17295 [Streptomyces amritsarensis]|uniref:General stress protein 17M-like domain-containing protein n=1 Tax=Streptomyces amritsarensis TaxID=681158 RepID=A0ABX3G3P3_9ACTN|nr:hypothetical protein AVW11_17295 [Streptomyces amritsarensis]
MGVPGPCTSDSSGAGAKQPARQSWAGSGTLRGHRQEGLERVAIIGHDLRLVEQVTGRIDYGRAALHGAASGALPGVLIGWLFGPLVPERT